MASPNIRRWLVRIAIPAVLLIGLGSALHPYARAAGLLSRMMDPQAHGWVADYSRHPVRVSRFNLQTRSGKVPVRLYVPQDLERPEAVVLVHGLQHLGIEEPRLQRFAQAIAESGVAVLTPQLPGIERYEISRASVTAIGDSIQAYSESRGGRPVGVIGMSFSGGLALIAAAEPDVSPHVAFVAAVGAHHDLTRVATFYATGTIPAPNGEVVKAQPHEYGALVIMFGGLEDFFAVKDLPVARETMQLLLYEQVDAAKQKAAELSPEGRTRMAQLFAHDQRGIQATLLESIGRNRERMDKLSPAGQLSGLRAPVLLLHGAADDIIPPSESKWLEQEIPRDLVKESLITPLLSHVDLQSVSTRDRAAVVHFMAVLLEMAAQT